MLKHFHKRDNCRLCEATNLELVVPITATPVADAYVPKEALPEKQECYPLDLYQCLSCGHVQLCDVVAPEILFTKYSYFTGRTGGLLKHFAEYAERVVRNNNVPKGSLVVDVGSNDGTFLRCFLDLGMQVLGVDPAENIAAAANASGIETLTAFFTSDVAKKIRAERGPARVVSANNVFAHTDDMAGMADAVRTLLADDGVFVFEVSYLLDVVEQMLLGTIFHEHVCYHSVRPLDAFLRRHGMELIDVHRVGIQGGSIIGTAQPLGGPRQAMPAVGELKALEDKADLHNPATLRAFSSKIEKIRSGVTEMVGGLHADGKVIAGFGAARSGTFLIYHFGLGEVLSFIVDDSADKQGLYSPGYHIPVLPTATLYERKPDYAFILAWVHSRAIIQNHQRFLDEGGRFIVCFPRIQVVSREAPL